MTPKTLLLLAYLVCTLNSCFAQKTMQKNDQDRQAKTLHPISQTSLEVKKGGFFYYNGALHGSVGIATAYQIQDTDIVKLHQEEVNYKNKEAVKQGMSGADEATQTFVFEALQKGETTVIIKEMFRGTVENSFTFKIIVK